MNDFSNTGVSIVIPVNFTKFLDETLSSVEIMINKSQTKIEHELILICASGRIDDVREIVAPYSKVLNVQILSQIRDGLSDAINLGILASRFEYIMRLDADDLVTPNRLASQIAFLENNPSVSVVGGQCLKISSNGDRLGFILYPIKHWTIRNLLVGRNCLAHTAICFRRKDIIEVGMYDRSLESCEDWELYLRLSIHGYRLHNLTEIVVARRIHDHQISNRNTGIDEFSELAIAKKLYDEFGQRSKQGKLLLQLSEIKRIRNSTKVPRFPPFSLVWAIKNQSWRFLLFLLAYIYTKIFSNMTTFVKLRLLKKTPLTSLKL